MLIGLFGAGGVFCPWSRPSPQLQPLVAVPAEQLVHSCLRKLLVDKEKKSLDSGGRRIDD